MKTWPIFSTLIINKFINKSSRTFKRRWCKSSEGWLNDIILTRRRKTELPAPPANIHPGPGSYQPLLLAKYLTLDLNDSFSWSLCFGVFSWSSFLPPVLRTHLSIFVFPSFHFLNFIISFFALSSSCLPPPAVSVTTAVRIKATGFLLLHDKLLLSVWSHLQKSPRGKTK